MANNDVVLLGKMLERARPATRSTLNQAEHEAYFVAQHFLESYEPSHDDLLGGIVDGSNDGGIDAIYVLANGYFYRGQVEAAKLGKRADIDLVILQVKNTTGLSESVIDKLRIAIPELLNFDRDERKLAGHYNSRLIEITRNFLEIVSDSEMPTLRIFVACAALRANGFHPKVADKAADLKWEVSGIFGSCDVTVSLLNASDVADLARQMKTVTRSLKLAETAVSADFTGGYVTLVRLDEFRNFITDEVGRLDASLFEANVRDYEGETSVNSGIAATLLERETNLDFWWLNNGITIIANRLQLNAKRLEMETPQIVNGLQTSHEIFKSGRDDLGRSLLVKVIEANQPQVRDRVIQATNSQTALASSALRATDKAQRQIEEHLRSCGYYYERRKNMHKNAGVSLDKIVSVEQLSSSIAAVLLQLPHLSRASPDLLFDPENYALMFNEEHPIAMYGGIVEISLGVREFLRNRPDTRSELENYEFQLMTASAAGLTRKRQPRPTDVASIRRPLSVAVLGDMLRLIREEYASYAKRTGEPLFERISKEPRVSEAISKRVAQYLSSTVRT